jgi:hypothetical protein
MPKNKVSDPITDQEIAFARLVLSGAMTDRHAAEAVGLNPDSAAYTKSKPHVRAYMLEHRTRISCLATPDTATCAAFIKESRMESANANHPNRKSGGAAVQQQLVQQEVEGLRRLNVDREQVLARLWEIAHLSPEMTRGSITGQVKALSMIVAMQNFIPDRRAVSSEKKSPPAPTPQIYAADWRARQQAATIGPQPGPAPAQQEREDEPGVPEPKLATASVADPPPHPDPSQSTFANRFTPSEAPPPYVPLFTAVPDLGIPFSIKKNPFNPFVHPR